MAPRVPYVPEDIQGEEAEKLRKRRGGSLLELDRILLHSPALASGWNAMFGTLRTETTLPETVKEIAICWVAVLNKAEYEWEQHAPIAIAAGIPKQAIDKLHKGDPSELDELHSLVVEYTSKITKDIDPGNETFNKIKAAFGDQGAVELTAVIAGYNMVSRFLVALQVGQ